MIDIRTISGGDKLLDQVLPLWRTHSPTLGFCAPTAHYFMQLLNGVVRFNPKVVLDRAAKVVRFSSRFNYNLDSLALSETVRLVETLLTDYPEEVREGDSLKNLLEIPPVTPPSLPRAGSAPGQCLSHFRLAPIYSSRLARTPLGYWGGASLAPPGG